MGYGTRAKEWITDHDVTQKNLAETFQITDAMLSNYLTGRNPVSGFDQTFREMSHIGLQTVVMAYDHQVAVPCFGVLRETHTTVECGIYVVSFHERQVNAVVVAAATRPVMRTYAALVWVVVAFQRIDERYGNRLRQ